MDAPFLQNHGIVGSGESHGGVRISGVSRAPQHEASRGDIAARNQIIPSPERRGDFTRIEAVDRIESQIVGVQPVTERMRTAASRTIDVLRETSRQRLARRAAPPELNR